MTREIFTVCILDEDPVVCSYVCSLMGSIGVGAKAFASAPEFFAACDPASPACLILDLRMAILSGRELRTHLAERGFALPLIFTSAYGDVTAAVDTMRRGAFDFLQKPFREHALIDCVNRARAYEESRLSNPGDRDRLSGRAGRTNA